MESHPFFQHQYCIYSGLYRFSWDHVDPWGCKSSAFLVLIQFFCYQMEFQIQTNMYNW